jgi:large subunit ribosomal protein L6
MSRVGKKPIKLPEGVKVDIKDRNILVESQKGSLSLAIPENITVKTNDNDRLIIVERSSNKHKIKALHGTIRQLINNMVIGVTKGFEKELICEGLGYKLSMEGKSLKLEVGYSHPVIFTPPDGINIELKEKNIIVVKGIDKYLVGETAAKIRRIRPVEPYKLKGIRYKDEYIKRKAGKSGTGK